MGTVVTISGTNFSTTPAGNTVKLNDLPAIVTIAQSTQLQVTVPEGARTGKFSVMVNASTAVAGADFAVLDFTDQLLVRGLFVTFERRGWPERIFFG